MPLRKNDEFVTYADSLTWPDDERWELIDGIPFNMSPAPSPYHQEILGNLCFEIHRFLKEEKGEGKVYMAPLDVRLPEAHQTDEETSNVVQPDILVICNKEKIDDKGCKGAPDFIIEIVSPGTAKKDMKFKLMLYEKHGVPEYWIVQPAERIVMVFKLNEQKNYDRAEVYSSEDTIPLTLKESALEIDLDSVF
ncbi:MAG: Uma2 family endonuclease [bacterium]|nr:Uma2 family endonuclease [bacterium]